MINFSNILNTALKDEDYINIVGNVITHPAVIAMKEYSHHGSISRYEHCVNVSYIGYKIANKFKWDCVSIARAGLLHDFFLYNWRETKSHWWSFRKSHAFIHGKIARINSEKYFDLNPKEKEMIEKHMWPLTIIPPRYIMTYFIGIIDKYCAVREVIDVKFHLRDNNICTDP